MSAAMMLLRLSRGRGSSRVCGEVGFVMGEELVWSPAHPIKIRARGALASQTSGVLPQRRPRSPPGHGQLVFAVLWSESKASVARVACLFRTGHQEALPCEAHTSIAPRGVSTS